MAESNQLNPSISRLGLPGNIWIYAGTASSDTTIQAEVGTPGTDQAAGSLYLSSTGSGGVWQLSTTNWTRLN